MTKTPVLTSLDFSIPFVLETNTFGFAMGAVLLQNSHLIAFFSKTFYPRLQRASTYVWELHAITTTVCKWRHYLLGHHFVIIIDHRNLKELMPQAIQTPEQQTHLAKLLGYDYIIQYKAGSNNVVIDVLSRIPNNHLFSLSLPNFEFEEQLGKSLLGNSSYHELSEQIFFHGKIWLPTNSQFTFLLLEEFHKTPLGGHMGVAKTLHCLETSFFWPCMPPSHGFTTILVVVDRFSKGVHLGALPPHYTASKVVVLFMDIVSKLHKFPHNLVFDRDSLFVSSF